MATEDLDRRFFNWGEQDKGDPEVTLQFAYDFKTSSWANLLQRKRVVILAEAGSGKSTEFNEQHRLAIANGKDSFIATVRDTATRGFEAAIGATSGQKCCRQPKTDHLNG
jgi:hypothetical protein